MTPEQRPEQTAASSSTAERHRHGPWHNRARNTLLTLGAFALFTILHWLLAWLEASVVSGVSFPGAGGAVLLYGIGALPSVVAAAVTGLVAASFLHYRWAAAVLFTFGLFWVYSSFTNMTFFQRDTLLIVAIVVEFAAVVALLPIVFWLRQQRLRSPTLQPQRPDA